MSVFLSSDGGANWTTVQVGSQKDGYANAVARDPSNPNVLYAGGHDGKWQALLYKSVNGGASWTDITKGIRDDILDVDVDPLSPQIVYAVNSGAVWKSSNGGGTWTELSIRGGSCLVINPKNPNELFLGTSYGGVFHSGDKGATWEDIGADMDINNVLCLDLDPSARILYAGTWGGGIVKRRL